jgi:hypothetical protein
MRMPSGRAVATLVVLLTSTAAVAQPRVQDRLIDAARGMLGKPYVFGGLK